MTGVLRTFVFLPGMSLSRDVVGLFSKFTLRMQKIQQQIQARKMYVGKENQVKNYINVHVLYALNVKYVAFNTWRPSFLVMIEV